MNKFCIKCGERKNLINEYCEECFKEENPILEKFKEIKIVICNQCKNYLYKNSWKKALSENIEENLEKIFNKIFIEKITLNNEAKNAKVKVKINFLKKLKIGNDNEIRVELEVHAEGFINGTKVEEEYVIPGKIKCSICNNCKKVKNSYFEAKLQIRPKDEKILKFVKDYCKSRKNLFISKVEEDKHGYDVYLSDQKETRNLGNVLKKKFEGEVKESKKIFGRKDGRDIYRATVCFRLNE